MLLGKCAFKSFAVKGVVLRRVRAGPEGDGRGRAQSTEPQGRDTGGHEQRSCFGASLLLAEKPQEKLCAKAQSYRLDPVTSKHDSGISTAPPLRTPASVLLAACHVL